MAIHSYSDEGFVLARRSYGEADRILSVYAKNHGRIALLAKGVRRPTSRKRGHLEIFNLIRFQCSRGKGLDLITEAEIVESFAGIRKNLNKVALAYYFMEVIGRTTHEHEVHKEVFDLLVAYLDKLTTESSLKKLRLAFVSDLLTTIGFWPKGSQLQNPDTKLEEVIERHINSVDVGKKISF